ncbi:MAG: serine/threonine-protein kinase RsbW [Acidimicrobiaceae bacterium]|jgi:anti-sigma regulatory factor (Ser/Thr protein kinase)
MSEPFRLRLSLPSQPLSVAAARNIVRSLPRTSQDVIAEIELIVSELVTNAIRHGSDRADDVIELELEASPTLVSGCVRDHGAPFTIPDGPPKDGGPGGFGLFISRTLADTLTVERSGTGNAVRFTATRTP